jgi:hypothetical protein
MAPSAARRLRPAPRRLALPACAGPKSNWVVGWPFCEAQPANSRAQAAAPEETVSGSEVHGFPHLVGGAKPGSPVPGWRSGAEQDALRAVAEAGHGAAHGAQRGAWPRRSCRPRAAGFAVPGRRSRLRATRWRWRRVRSRRPAPAGRGQAVVVVGGGAGACRRSSDRAMVLSTLRPAPAGAPASAAAVSESRHRPRPPC